MEQRSTEEVARERLEQEEQERREARLLDLEQEEVLRREAAAKEKEHEERLAAARAKLPDLDAERLERARRFEECVASAVREADELLAFDVRHRAALKEAGDYVPSGSVENDVGNVLAVSFGRLVARNNTHRDPNAPTLVERDALCQRALRGEGGG